MSIRNLIEYRKQSHMERGTFITYETGALRKGYGMCFDFTYASSEAGETLNDNFGGRGMRTVVTPKPGNNLAFAGVLCQDYPALPQHLQGSGPRVVDLWLPGSCAEIAVGIATVANSTRLSCLAGTEVNVGGLFVEGALPGRGRAIALQTKATGAGKVIGSSIDGTATYATATKTITKASLFANAAVGDRVIVVAGEATRPGEYIITQVASANAVVVNKDVSATNGAKLAIYVISGNPTVLAYLEDGEESGLVEFVTPVSGSSQPPMRAGTTIIMGGITIAADAIPALANGLCIGERKAFKCTGTITTGDYLVTPSVTGLQLDGATALVSAELDGANDYTELRWNGQKWRAMENMGTTLSAT